MLKLRTAYPYGLYEKIEDDYKKQSLFQLNNKLINHLPNSLNFICVSVASLNKTLNDVGHVIHN